MNNNSHKSLQYVLPSNCFFKNQALFIKLRNHSKARYLAWWKERNQHWMYILSKHRKEIRLSYRSISYNCPECPGSWKVTSCKTLLTHLLTAAGSLQKYQVPYKSPRSVILTCCVHRGDQRECKAFSYNKEIETVLNISV